MLVVSLLAIIHREWIALSCCYGSPLSSLPCWNPPPLLSLFIQPFTKNSPQQVDNRSVKTNAWGVNRMGADYVSSIFRSANKLQNPELLLTSVFRTHGKRRKVVMLCFLPNMPKYSTAVSLWSGRCCCQSSVAMPWVSLWQARWLSPAKVIAPLRCKYRSSHTGNRQRLLFSSQKPGSEDDSCFGSKCTSSISSLYK